MNINVSKTFKLRAISTIILLPLVVAGILFLPALVLAVISGIVFALAAWEWLQMAIPKKPRLRVLLLVLLIIVAASLLSRGLNPLWIYLTAILWWIAGFVGICYYPGGTKIWHEIIIQPVVGLLLFVPPWLAFNALLSPTFGRKWALLGCCLIWAADIGAYVFGKLWGKQKLVPHVSPAKTWAGFYGACVFGCIVMLTFYQYFAVEITFSLWFALWVAALTVLFAVVGDLVESMFKRVYGIKDSGKLIPGHGGVFDRIDSMLAALPIYYLALQLLHNISVARVY